MFDDHGFPVPDGVLTGVAGADGDEDLVETGPFVIEIKDDGVGAVASLDQSWGVDLDATVPYCDGVIDHKESFLYNISEAHVSCMFHEEHWLVLMKNRTIGVMLVRQYDAAWGSRHCRSDRLACENGIVFPSMLLIHHGFEHIGWN